MQTVFSIRNCGPGLHEFTAEVVRFVRDSGFRQGLLTLFVQHTSCSLLVQENADPDDMPAHIKAALTAVSLSIPVMDGRPALGTWQGIHLFEHRERGHARQVVGHLSE